MEHRIEKLHLAVHTPAGREAPAARLAERFTREVVERFGELVEARFPGRVVLIRNMAFRWSLSEVEMADPAEATSRAAELAGAVAAQADGSLHASDTIVVFADEAAWLAAYLRERAAGVGEGWFHAAWRDAERHGSADPSSLRRETMLTALSRLRTTDELAAVLAALPRPTITAFGGALGIGAGTAACVGLPEQTLRGPHDPAETDSADMGAALLIASLVAADHRSGEGLLAPVAPALLGRTEPDGQASPATRFGGLFYLLSLALELGIGESLWKACLPEGLVLAHAATVLLGPDVAGDPAPAIFGGVTASEMLKWPAVSPEQQADVCTELLAATVCALPRHGLAPSPEVFLDLAPSSTGRMLGAFDEGPFALFAWPAPDARSAAAGLTAFLSLWPDSLPLPRAPDVLLKLDTSGRLRSPSGPMLRRAPFLPWAPTAPASALLTQVCGAMAELFMLRAEGAPADASEVVCRYLALPGHVELAPEAMTVVLPMKAIDLAVRRAALDRDAGWVPWLRRNVRVEFSPDGAEKSGLRG